MDTKLKKITINILSLFFLIALFTINSCRNRNYIDYYNKVNEIDSIYRFQKDTLKVINQYRKLFRKYEPKNQERIQELETFIKLSSNKHRNFGGKRMLSKLTLVLAPYGNAYQKHLAIYKQYGIDSTNIKIEIANWKNNLTKKLVDSFSVAFVRDQQEERSVKDIMIVNDKKNAELLMLTLENYGFPSIHKIGIIGNQEVFMPMDNFLSHMIESEYYPFFKTEILKYVKSGECPPRYYAVMIDKHNLTVSNENILYGAFSSGDTVIDTLKIDKNRKSIGLPTLRHAKKITKDFFKKK